MLKTSVFDPVPKVPTTISHNLYGTGSKTEVFNIKIEV